MNLSLKLLITGSTACMASAACMAMLTNALMPQAIVRADSASTESANSAPDLANLPTGRYYFAPPAPNSASRRFSSFVLFRKSGRTIIGWDRRSTIEPACFRGFIQGSQIINATRVFSPYQPDSAFQSGETIDLSGYESTEHEPSEIESKTLQTCINFFWR